MCGFLSLDLEWSNIYDDNFNNNDNYHKNNKHNAEMQSTTQTKKIKISGVLVFKKRYLKLYEIRKLCKYITFVGIPKL